MAVTCKGKLEKGLPEMQGGVSQGPGDCTVVLTTDGVPGVCLSVAVPEHVLTAELVTLQAPVLTVALPAQEDLPEVTGQVGLPHLAVAQLLVDSGGDVAGGVAGEQVGHQQQEIPLQTDRQEPVAQ